VYSGVEALASVTVTAAVPLWPPLVAVTVVVPTTSPVTRPLPLAGATVGVLDAHVTERPVRTLPLASLSVALNCMVAATDTLAAAGLTVTLATGTLVTVMVAEPLFPSLVAVIVAEPAATPVTKPLALTVATAGLLLAQVTARPLRAVPFESFGVAVNWAVALTVRLADAGFTVTATTGTESAGTAVLRIATSVMLFQVLLLLPWPTMRT